MTSESEKKTGTLRRTRRSARRGRGGGMPRIMWLAIVVCVVGAVILFRSGGGDAPTSIGENQTVVTAPDLDIDAMEQVDLPHSGDVEISEQSRDLTPEASHATTETTAEPTPAAVEPKPARTTPTTRTIPTPTPVVIPTANGPYVVQAGSYGDPANADKEAARLTELGWNALVKAADTSDGSMVYRVQIVYFKSRSDAETFIRQNRRHIPDAIPAHR